MDRKLVQEVIACLPQERTLFHYFKDRYALLLLAYAAGNGTTIAALKESSFRRLLDKALVKPALASCGDGRLNTERLCYSWPCQSEPFLLTVGLWGSGDRSWDQTSRRGYNLVLRLNFSEQHSAHYRRLVKPHGETLNYNGHPIQRRRRDGFFRDTLAWCRIDLDFANNEALIEEVQSDWVSNAQLEQRFVKYCGRHRLWAKGSAADVRRYLDDVLVRYGKIWDEAMLAAALCFIRDELGLRKIFYHEFSTGNAMKGIQGGWCPPRSLYTELPRRFCFQLEPDAPAFLRADKFGRRVLKKLGHQARFYQLEL